MDAWLLSSTLVRFALTLLPFASIAEVCEGLVIAFAHVCLLVWTNRRPSLLLLCVLLYARVFGVLMLLSGLCSLVLPLPLCVKQCCSLQHGQVGCMCLLRLLGLVGGSLYTVCCCAHGWVEWVVPE
jgi:hypothetical protein